MMTRRVVVTFITIVLSVMTAMAQNEKPWLLRGLSKVGAFIDSLTKKGVDPHYIEVPKEPGQIMLRYNINEMNVKSHTHLSAEQLSQRGLVGELHCDAHVKTPVFSSLGLWVGYRGYGLGYSFSISNKSGNSFSIGATGSNFGINLRTRKFETDMVDVHIWGHDEEEVMDNTGFMFLYDPVTVKYTIFDAYYMLNGKRFSYAAAYDQSVIQRRSAGSLMFGVMWYGVTLDYVNPKNGLVIQMLSNIGRTKIQEGSIGVGYAYNWVPVKNLLVNVTAMPILSLYNRSEVCFYESNYDIFLMEGGQTSTKGKKKVPDDFSWLDDITIEETGSTVRHANVSLNIDARVSVTYNFGRFFLDAYGQLNHFGNTIDSSRLRLTDWYVNASLGFRF